MSEPKDGTPKINYGSNSHKAKESGAADPKPKLEAIVEAGSAKTVKKPLNRKIADMFTGDDMRSVVGYVAIDVGVPAIKNLISDMVSQGIERLMFGDSRPRSSSVRPGYTSYNRMSSSGGGVKSGITAPTMSRQARATHNFDDIILQERGQAEVVLDKLVALVEQYDVATVSDLYELVGVTGAFTDDKWGWVDLRTARARRVREGYLLELPRPIPID